MVCRDYVRGKLGLPQWNERGTRNKVVHAVSRRRNQEVRPTIAFGLQRWAEARDPRGTSVPRYLYSRPNTYRYLTISRAV